MIRVFTSKILDEALSKDERLELIADFKKYKSGVLPAWFGKDVLYDHPYNLDIIKLEQVRHIHLATHGVGFPFLLLKLNEQVIST